MKVAENYADETERLRLLRVKEFTDYFGFVDGRWPKKMQHCRLLPLHNDDVYKTLNDIKEASNDVKGFKMIMTNNSFTCRVGEKGNMNVEYKEEDIEDETVNGNLRNAFFTIFNVVFSKATTTLFGTSSFAKRIAAEPDFIKTFSELSKLLGKPAVKSLFSTDSFCVRIATEPDFIKTFSELSKLLGKLVPSLDENGVSYGMLLTVVLNSSKARTK